MGCIVVSVVVAVESCPPVVFLGELLRVVVRVVVRVAVVGKRVEGVFMVVVVERQMERHGDQLKQHEGGAHLGNEVVVLTGTDACSPAHSTHGHRNLRSFENLKKCMPSSHGAQCTFYILVE